MTSTATTRRSAFAAAGLLAAASVLPLRLSAESPAEDPASFLAIYDAAWGRHDAHALAMLHAEDVLVVNRFGSMVEGRAELEQVMAFLHGPGGPFHAISFPAQELRTARKRGSDMATLHASWKSPWRDACGTPEGVPFRGCRREAFFG